MLIGIAAIVLLPQLLSVAPVIIALAALGALAADDFRAVPGIMAKRVVSLGRHSLLVMILSPLLRAEPADPAIAGRAAPTLALPPLGCP